MPRLKNLSHDQLLTQLHYLIQQSHTLEVELIAYLGEIDTRRLYLQQACPSMFHYCVHVLHFAEGVAFKRIAVARAARRFPELLVALRSGDLHLTAASLIAPHLDRKCAAEWVAAAHHKTAREIKKWIADRKPKADVTASVRRAPTPRWAAEPGASTLAAPSRPALTGAAIRPDAASPAAPRPQQDKSPRAALSPERDRAHCEPLGAQRYCVRFTANEVMHEELQELRALLRHQIPDGDVAKIMGRALHVLLEQVRKQKTGARSSPRAPQAPASGSSPAPLEAPSKTPSRNIPAAIRRAVWTRDEGRCTYVSRGGRQCGSQEFLELHHQVPWARCREHSLSNIHLRCRPHNQHAAELDFGTQHMAAFRKRGCGRSAAEVEAGGAGGPESLLDPNPLRLGKADRGAGPGPAEPRRGSEQQRLGSGTGRRCSAPHSHHHIVGEARTSRPEE